MGEAEKQLKAARRKRERAASQTEQASEEMRRAVKKAAAAGVSKSDIARIGGISRMTVYEMLR